MAAFYTCPAERALVPVMDGNVATPGPDPLAAQFHGRPEGVTVAGTTVADSIQPPFLPLAVGSMHEAFLVGPAYQFFGFLFGKPSTVPAIKCV